MRLTLHTDLAFRTLIHLGLQREGRVQTEEIAAAWRISSNHLDKVVQRLAAAGLQVVVRIRADACQALQQPAHAPRIPALALLPATEPHGVARFHRQQLRAKKRRFPVQELLHRRP